jgi:putative transposase
MPAWKEKDRNPERLEQRRRDAVKLILGGKLSKSEVASTLGVSYTSVKNWWKAYVDGGRKMAALDPGKHTGRPPSMSRNQLRRLARLLSKGAERYGFETDVWTAERVAWLIKEKFGVGYHPAHVSKLLHSLNLSWQKAEGVARERDETKVRDWVHNALPDIKKDG